MHNQNIDTHSHDSLNLNAPSYQVQAQATPNSIKSNLSSGEKKGLQIPSAYLANPQEDMETLSKNSSCNSKLSTPQNGVPPYHGPMGFSDQDEMKTLREQLIIKGLPMNNCRLMVKAVPDSNFGAKSLELEEHDILQTFKHWAHYGPIVSIEIDSDSCVAYVTFHDVIDAFMAQNQLDKSRLTKDPVTLHVSYSNHQSPNRQKQQMMVRQNNCQTPITPFSYDQTTSFVAGMPNHSDPHQLREPQPMMQPMQPQFVQNSPEQMVCQPKPVVMPDPQMAVSAPVFNPSGMNMKVAPFMPTQQKPSFETGRQNFNAPSKVSSFNMTTDEDDGVKYTCRYDIQIHNEKEFQVARRVIGSKGANMKRIIDQCSRGFDKSINPYEVVKLRLRGKGSGFKEGPQQIESEDPLNLCISSKYKDKYEFACHEMETLLLKVYDEFYHFYKYKKSRPDNWGTHLHIQKEETLTKPKTLIEDVETTQSEELKQIQASFQQMMLSSNTGSEPFNPSQFGSQPNPFLQGPSSFSPSPFGEKH